MLREAEDKAQYTTFVITGIIASIYGLWKLSDFWSTYPGYGIERLWQAIKFAVLLLSALGAFVIATILLAGWLAKLKGSRVGDLSDKYARELKALNDDESKIHTFRKLLEGA